MDKTRTRVRVMREQRFREPSDLERRMGLWVDRIGEAVNAPRRPPFRILGQYAAVYVLEGDGWFASRTAGRLPVAAHDVMLLFPDEPAHYSPRVSWRTLWVVWNGPDAARLHECGYITPRRPVLPDRLRAVRQAYTELKLILQAEGRDAVLRRKIVVLNMVQILRRSLEPARRGADPRIEQAARILSERSADPFSVARAAARSRLSPAQFRRLFKEHTGVGPLRFVTTQRVARAKELLAAGLPIKAAAVRTGFPDVFHFMRVFKKVTGLTAGQFSASVISDQ